MAELALNLAGLLVLIVVTLFAVRGCATLISHLMWRSSRPRLTACAERIAAALNLAVADSPDPRMGLWYGRLAGAELWLATGAHHLGATQQMFDPAGPCFVDDIPPVAFARLCNVLLVVRNERVLPTRFSLSSAYGIPAVFVTGDLQFDQRFKLNGAEPEAVRQLFGDPALRDKLLGIFGPDVRTTRLLPLFGGEPRRDGTGVVLWANEQGIAVHWSSPCEVFAAEFGLAIVRAASTLAAAVRSS